MELSVFHDGQFYVGLVEYKVGSKSKFVKYTLVQNQMMEKSFIL